MNIQNKYNRAKIIWLWTLCMAILLMVLIGGLTRLTDSGLSMVEWKPIMGIVPPLNEHDWQTTFDKYKNYPEYQKINHQMTLNEFKFIFYMEYLHRIMGRVYGLMVLFPLAFFWFKKALLPREKMQYIAVLFLVGLQGLVGWYMVRSGLVDVPYVSQYRLAIHLCMAILLLSLTYWVSLEQFRKIKVFQHTGYTMIAKTWITMGALLILQILLGAFMAGLDAGHVSSSFPKMMGAFIPSGMISSDYATLENFSANPITVHFFHRAIATVILIFSLWITTKYLFFTPGLKNKTPIFIFSSGLVLQFLIGVSTVLFHVPISLASFHQILAILVWVAWVHVLFLILVDNKEARKET